MLERFVIHVTKECNADCVYCYERDKTSTYTWEEVKRNIDAIVETNKEFGIEFLGGEPMMAFDLIKKSYFYLESIKEVKVTDYVITTNSTILSQDALDFLIENPKVIWAASIDGTRYANQLRKYKGKSEKGAQKGTHEDSIRVLKKVISAIGSNRVSVHITTHPYNIYLLYRSIGFLYNLGVRLVGVGTVESTIPVGREYAEEFIKQMDLVSEEVLFGKWKDLVVDILDHVKPRTDIRTYIYDKSGKLIFENYGRVDNSALKNNQDFKVIETTSESSLIPDIREEAFLKHKRRS